MVDDRLMAVSVLAELLQVRARFPNLLVSTSYGIWRMRHGYSAMSEAEHVDVEVGNSPRAGGGKVPRDPAEELRDIWGTGIWAAASQTASPGWEVWGWVVCAWGTGEWPSHAAPVGLRALASLLGRRPHLAGTLVQGSQRASTAPPDWVPSLHEHAGPELPRYLPEGAPVHPPGLALVARLNKSSRYLQPRTSRFDAWFRRPSSFFPFFNISNLTPNGAPESHSHHASTARRRIEPLRAVVSSVQHFFCAWGPDPFHRRRHRGLRGRSPCRSRSSSTRIGSTFSSGGASLTQPSKLSRASRAKRRRRDGLQSGK